jgi:DNA-binding MarR family transcriptional regulator
MDTFSKELNDLLVETFWNILKVEEQMLQSGSGEDLSISELHVIESVGKSGAPGSTISEIALDLDVALPSVTVQINKLQKKGYVEKHKNERDGRVVYAKLTEQGRKINKIHSYFHRQMVLAVAEDMNEMEKEVLIQGITKLRNFFVKKSESEYEKWDLRL